MTGAASCCTIGDHFNHRVAERELTKYRRIGPNPSTRRLLAAIREKGIDGNTVLDIGGGIGTIAMELLGSGATHATVIDASAAYLAAARDESDRRQLAARMSLMHGNFATIAADIEPADVVTLDKVVCCYPDLGSLIAVSTARTRRLYGIIYPRDKWWVRLAVAAENFIRRLRGSSFRVFVFANTAIDEAIRASGLSLVKSERDLSWVIALYERRGAHH